MPLLAALALGVILPRPAGAAEPAARATQMIVVVTGDWSAVDGRLQRYERATPRDAWRPAGSPVAVVVGKNGLGWGIGVVPTDGPELRGASDPVKREGDGKAPAGIFGLGTAFGYAPEPLPGTRLPYLHLTSTVECVDDPASKHYNRVLDRSRAAPDWNSSERMRSAGEAYRWGIVVDHNRMTAEANDAPPLSEGGSCIFLHIWRGPGQGTAGCTAMPQAELEPLLTWLDPARKPLLVQLPARAYERLRSRWQLPAFPVADARRP